MAVDRCKSCTRTFQWAPSKENELPPDSCGRLVCDAVASWTRAQWEGQASMAESRRRVGVELNELDREALRRVNGGVDTGLASPVRSQNNHPETSRLAAKSVNSRHQNHLVLWLVGQIPDPTGDAIAVRINDDGLYPPHGMTPNAVCSRLDGLHTDLGLVRRAGRTALTTRGRSAEVWEYTPAGVEEIRHLGAPSEGVNA